MQEILKNLGITEKNNGTSTGAQWINSKGKTLTSVSPVDAAEIAKVICTDNEAYEQVITKAEKAFAEWRMWPSPKRGDVVRQIGEALRAKKESLGRLVSYEMGKSLQEGYGEVQEMIDICDF